jgi:CRP/FNR family transcriptional regulator, anaerobic regulatory protein
MIHQPLIDHLESYLPLGEAEKSLLMEKFVNRKVKRRHTILQQGHVCHQYTFVVEGCFRMYGIDLKGVERNIQFTAENDWITDIGSFHSGKPSKLFIEAIEPSTILQVEKQDLIFFYRNTPSFNLIFRVIIEDKFVELQNQVLENIRSTAQERYTIFLEQYSELALRLSSLQIASYLGITPEFLSKIRKDLAVGRTLKIS